MPLTKEDLLIMDLASLLRKIDFPKKTINILKKKGYKDIKEKRHFSGLHVIKVQQGTIDKTIVETGVDPRREGKALIK
tara:strand:- start:231 stop:464 length:234 start_codon:yes stop_codon:yes gene_type:complete